ncbi:hypothetical protein [Calothrix sp. 336/3]|nr:hypothetical protein [Calothrix sp. 336/3]
MGNWSLLKFVSLSVVNTQHLTTNQQHNPSYFINNSGLGVIYYLLPISH